MNVFPIRNPLDGEQVVAVDPPLVPRVDAGWRRRLHLFTGRSLDATALAAEQRARAARSALLARALSPGIVAGLEASLSGTGFGDAMLDVAPGLGITAWGEDVRLPRALSVRLDQIDVIGAGEALPAVLVLQPVLVEEIGGADPLDPCERDPQSEAFEDQRTVDACRPLLVSWPKPKDEEEDEEERKEKQNWHLPDAGPLWRNQLAWTVFKNALLGPLPWEDLGLPLGLIGKEAEPPGGLFLDRSIVARIGGRPRPRTSLRPEAGDPALWQARIQQFAEHLADLFADPKTTIFTAATHFERLPPAGLLPVGAATFARPVKGVVEQNDGGQFFFFPAGFQVGAAPIPLDELEPVFDASAPLAPLDFTKPEEVQLLVPVPSSLYEPDLLVREQVDSEFETTLAEFREDRNRWLGRHNDVRTKAAALTRALGGSQAKPPFPADDPDQQAAEIPTSPDPAEEELGTVPPFGPFLLLEMPRLVTAFDMDLANEFQTGRFQKIQKEWDVELLAKEGLDGLIRVLALKVSKANDKIDLGFLSLQTEIYRIRQYVLGNVAGTRLATSPVLAEIAQGESAKVTRENLAKVFESKGQAVLFSGVQPEAAPAADAGFVATDLALSPRLDFAAIDLRSTVSKGTATLDKDLSVAALAGLATAGTFQIDAAVVSDDIRQAKPLPGVAYDFRDLSIVERLKDPPARQAQDYAMANLLQILNGLEELGLVVDDLKIPLYESKTVEVGEGTAKRSVTVRIRADQRYDEVRTELPAKVMGQFLSAVSDEANVLGDAVSFQESASLFLRRLEGRVQLYQAALDRCRQVAEQIRALLAAARQRLATLDRELAEARHDVTVALALLEEETRRIDGINNRRLDTLTHHVPFLAYHRSRVVVTLAETPVRSLDPGLFEDPVPAALARPADAPAELREMVELLRDAPLRWFRRLPPLLAKLDRLDVLQTTLRLAKSRAEVTVTRPFLAAASLAPSPAAEGTSRTLAIQRQKMVQSRAQMARIDLAAVEQQSWKGAAELAKQVLSLGDLLDIPHGRADVARLGARELDEILRVATALWADFAEVLPALRLDWVERLSQFDAPFDLHRLSNLPRWEEIEVLGRRALQALADWLFQRVDPGEPEAVELINDLVRVCLLLASHAPVDRIVAGHVAEDTPVRPGATVPLVVDLSRVRIGMHVVLYSQEKTVARGVVEDLGGGRATARVLEADAGQVSVAKNARVEFTEAVWKVTK